MANANDTSPACTKCRLHPCFIDRWGNLRDLCETCEKARIDEISRICNHYEQHPDECCCDTFLGRDCCMAPVHGDMWRVNAISDGQKFCYSIRARSRHEAREVGQEMCQDNGEECISVSKLLEQDSDLVS